ncbi:unnamed protein product, partial [marine sediment metagenome]
IERQESTIKEMVSSVGTGKGAVEVIRREARAIIQTAEEIERGIPELQEGSGGEN